MFDKIPIFKKIDKTKEANKTNEKQDFLKMLEEKRARGEELTQEEVDIIKTENKKLVERFNLMTESHLMSSEEFQKHIADGTMQQTKDGSWKLTSTN